MEIGEKNPPLINRIRVAGQGLLHPRPTKLHLESLDMARLIIKS